MVCPDCFYLNHGSTVEPMNPGVLPWHDYRSISLKLGFFQFA